jgi:hypothetical protein
MLSRTKLALAAALILGAAGAAQAANDNQSDPNRGFAYGPLGQRMGGSAVNPVHHLSTRGKAPRTTDEGAFAFAPGASAGSCAQRFKSFDPATGTYLGRDGERHPCK